MQPLSSRVKVLMSIALLFGFFGTCCGLPTLFFGQAPEIPEGVSSELLGQLEILIAQQQVIVEQPVLRVWSYLAALLSVGLGFAHFGCFWGYLQRKEWAKQLHLILALIKIVENIMGGLIHAVYFEPAFALKMGDEIPSLAVRLVSGMLGSVCFLILPILVIVLIMTQSSAKPEKGDSLVDPDAKTGTEPSSTPQLKVVEEEAEEGLSQMDIDETGSKGPDATEDSNTDSADNPETDPD